MTTVLNLKYQPG